MTLLFIGKTECKICNKVINTEDDFYGFPAFVGNVKDPLWFFNDAAFHTACLTGTKEGKKAMRYAELTMLRGAPENRKCIATGELITKQQDHLYIGYLTSEESSPLHQFNFVQINIVNLPQWPDREILLKELIIRQKPGCDSIGISDKELNRLIDLLASN